MRTIYCSFFVLSIFFLTSCGSDGFTYETGKGTGNYLEQLSPDETAFIDSITKMFILDVVLDDETVLYEYKKKMTFVQKPNKEWILKSGDIDMKRVDNVVTEESFEGRYLEINGVLTLEGTFSFDFKTKRSDGVPPASSAFGLQYVWVTDENGQLVVEAVTELTEQRVLDQIVEVSSEPTMRVRDEEIVGVITD